MPQAKQNSSSNNPDLQNGIPVVTTTRKHSNLGTRRHPNTLPAFRIFSAESSFELRKFAMSQKEFIPESAYIRAKIPKNGNGFGYCVEVVTQVGEGHILLNFEMVDLVNHQFILQSESSKKVDLIRFQTYLFNNYPKYAAPEWSMERAVFVKSPEFYPGDDSPIFGLSFDKFQAVWNGTLLSEMTRLEAMDYLLRFNMVWISYDACREFDEK